MDAIALFDLTWKSVLVPGVAGLAALALRRSPASARHLVWTLSTAGLLVLPALALAVPAWTCSVLPARRVPAAARETTASASPIVLATTLSKAGFGDLNEESRPASGVGPAAVTPTVGGTASNAPAARVLPGPATWVLGSWSVVMVVLLSVPLLGRLGFGLLVRDSFPLEGGEWCELADEMAARIGLRRRVSLLQCRHALMPMTSGWLRPVVLLPAGSDAWPADRRRQVLLHELAHVRRLDCLTQAVAQVACAVYWFNPLAWLAAGRMRVERERACDDMVLCAGARPSDYALLLLEMARGSQSWRLAGLAAVSMARPSQLEGRLLAILDPARRRGGLGPLAAVLGVGLMAAVLVPLSALRLRAQEPGTPPRAPAARSDPKSTDAGRMTVTGRVIDPDGKPIAGARVGVVARIHKTGGPNRLYGSGRADADGRFAIEVPRTRSDREAQLEVIARAPGWGLDGREIDPDATRPEATITLDPERPIRGRLVDLQGQPVAGVVLRLNWLRGREDHFWSYRESDPEAPGWPGPVTTAADGRFTVEGLGARSTLWLEPEGDRIALQQFKIEAGEDGRSSELTLAARPAQEVDVRVVRDDDGSPVAGAKVNVSAGWSSSGDSPYAGRSEGGTTDADGRARVVSWAARSFRVRAYPPEGQPYMPADRDFDWPKAAVRHAVEIKVKRGVAVRGRLVEEPSGRPVAGAIVAYYQTHRDNPLYRGQHTGATSKDDGTFTIVLPHGPGHLLVRAATPDYVHLRTSPGELGTGYLPDLPMSPDAMEHLDLKPGVAEAEVTMRLRRGVTVEARVVGPDGAPVDEAIAFGRSYTPYDSNAIPFSPFNGVAPTLPVRAGRVEFPGLDPEDATPFHLFDVKRQLGATVELSGKSAAGGPVTIRLEPCGSATVRYTDADGKPAAGHTPHYLELIVEPGAPFGTPEKTNASSVYLVNLDPGRYPRRTDADGRARFVTLIPGARYRLLKFGGGGTEVEGGEVVAVSGRTLELPDVVLKRGKP